VLAEGGNSVCRAATMVAMRSPVAPSRCLAIALSIVLAGCASAPELASPIPDAGPAPLSIPDAGAGDAAPMQPPGTELARGKASWYGPRFHGRRTASGERFDTNALTAAHRTLAFGTLVLVRNLQNGREVVVRINDRGPHVRDRIIDLSKAAAAALDLLQAGEAPVVLIGL
jgi:rare lipoprotein A